MNDVLVIGGGIVGLGTAYKLSQRGGRVLVLEKEGAVAKHQSGRNSGVLHSGIYYRPDSLKAKTCVAGRRQMQQFCDDHGIPWKRSGKVIVAIDESELPRLDDLLERGRRNGVDCERIGPDDLRRLEPHCAGIAAIHVKDAGVVDFRRVCARLTDLVGNVQTNSRVMKIEQRTDSVRLTTNAGSFEAPHVINCGGLYSDRIARLAGSDPRLRIVPFRGEYYHLTERGASLCRSLIYPVPDPALPFLGVHFTRSIDETCIAARTLSWHSAVKAIGVAISISETSSKSPHIAARVLSAGGCGGRRRPSCSDRFPNAPSSEPRSA